MVCAYKENQDGFTLVEISIVMIIIGLLIGGTFGGMKLIENMQVNKTVQDLKSFDAAGITFRDVYGRLPGDLTNPSVRLPNCTAAPCSTGGNGNRSVGRGDWLAIVSTDEEFTFWHHLQAANLITGVQPTTSMEFGEGQPESPLDGGYRMVGRMATVWASAQNRHLLWGGAKPSGSFGTYTPEQDSLKCSELFSLDSKIDDSLPKSGKVNAAGSCTSSTATDNTWLQTTGGVTPLWYVLAY